jgi:hypothetical protein
MNIDEQFTFVDEFRASLGERVVVESVSKD